MRLIAAATLIIASAMAYGASVSPPGNKIEFALCKPGAVVEFKQPKGTDVLELRCPGDATPVLRLPGCVGPHVKSDGKGNYAITCDKLVTKP